MTPLTPKHFEGDAVSGGSVPTRMASHRSDASTTASLLERSIAFVRLLRMRARTLRLAQTAASLTLLSLLALVPVFTIALSLFGALPWLAPLRASLLDFLAANFLLPSFSATLVRYLNQFAGKVSELSLVGAVAFLATAFSALLTIDRTLNRIWMTRSPRALSRRLTIYWTFLTLGPVLLAASVAVNGLFVSEFLAGTGARGAGRVWLSIIPWVMTVGGLTLLYRIVPNAPVLWRHAFCGAVLAALALEVTKRLFAFQIAQLPTYTVVYGAFAALPLFLMWLFAFWLTVLAGALLAATIPRWGSSLDPGSGSTIASRFERASRVLDRLLECARAGSPTLCPGEIRALFANDPVLAERTAMLLAELGYLDRYWRVSAPCAGASDSSRFAVGARAVSPAESGQTVWEEYWSLRPGAVSMSRRPLFDRLWFGRAGACAHPADLTAIDRALGDPQGVRGAGSGVARPSME